MDFFEKELQKIVGSAYPDAKYVGRAAYVNLGEGNRAKFEFVTLGHADNYVAIRGKIINQRDGEIDVNVMRFADILGQKQTSNPNFRDGIIPHVWTDNGNSDWYVYKPTQEDYGLLTKNVSEYVSIFQEESQEAGMSMNMDPFTL